MRIFKSTKKKDFLYISVILLIFPDTIISLRLLGLQDKLNLIIQHINLVHKQLRFFITSS
jgi:hypothetical protein